MALQAQDLTDNVVSIAQASGLFTTVLAHEPKSIPITGLTSAVWMQSLMPMARVSGLDATAARVEFTIRIYTSMLAEPQDTIDPAVLTATAVLMQAFTNDFTLDESVMMIDLLGAYGNPLSAKAGYLKLGDKLYRVMDITVPLIVDAVWQQTP